MSTLSFFHKKNKEAHIDIVHRHLTPKCTYNSFCPLCLSVSPVLFCGFSVQRRRTRVQNNTRNTLFFFLFLTLCVFLAKQSKNKRKGNLSIYISMYISQLCGLRDTAVNVKLRPLENNPQLAPPTSSAPSPSSSSSSSFSSLQTKGALFSLRVSERL